MRAYLFAGLLSCVLSVSCSRSDPATAREAEAQPASTPAATVRIGYQKSGAPFLLKSKDATLKERLHAENSELEWLEFTTGPLLLEAMRAGAVDLGYVGETPPVFAQAGGVPFVYVATQPPTPRSEAILVPAGSPLETLEDLRGKRLAFNRGSNVHYFALRALESVGLRLSDVQVTFLAPADARSAFDSGKIDAWAIWDPFYAAAELAGARVLKDGEGIVDNHLFYVARSEFARDHSPLLEIVLAAFSDLSDWAAKNPEEASRLTAAASGIGYEALLRSEKRHNYGLRPITPEILAKQQKIADAFLKIEIVPKPIDTNAAYLAKAGFKVGP
jgi:sulfonate transport system substrate-binding protein